MQTIKQISKIQSGAALFATVFLTVALLAPLSTAMAQTTDLLFSEYVEGASNNKALEIFNGTADVIELSEYQILRYSNGSSTASTIILDSHTMLPGSVYVLANEFADAGLLAFAQQTSAELNFNGNDTLVLKRGSYIVDSFGVVGQDPGVAWTCPGGTTINQTLRRLSGVCNGDSVVDDIFNPCVEFEFYSVDTFSGLGEHGSDCVSVGTNRVAWNTVKAQYR